MTADWLSKNTSEPLKGIFVTHLHFDHVQGIAELNPEIPLVVGPAEGTRRNILNRVIAKPTREALKDRSYLEEWVFSKSSEDELAFIDVFKDGSLFAIHTPGHTAGSTAFLVNAADGLHLITGDAVHTTKGWLGPTRDAQALKQYLGETWESVDHLRKLAAELPGIIVHPGHQSF